MSLEYAITLSKIVPGEPTGQISDLLEDFGFKSLADANKRFNEIELSPVYHRKELWAKDTDTRILKLVKEERYKP